MLVGDAVLRVGDCIDGSMFARSGRREASRVVCIIVGHAAEKRDASRLPLRAMSQTLRTFVGGVIGGFTKTRQVD